MRRRRNVRPKDISEVWVTTPSGYGSTNTKIRHYTATKKQQGSGISFASDATLGARFTINESGIYFIGVQDRNTAAFYELGISVNSTQLTTDADGITDADRLIWAEGDSNRYDGPICTVAALKVGDVVRPHFGGTLPGSTGAQDFFKIIQIVKF